MIQDGNVNAAGEVTQKRGNKMTKFYMDPKTAWSFDFEDFFLTPYNVLRRFLESSLQVKFSTSKICTSSNLFIFKILKSCLANVNQAGTVNEILGNGLVAENTLTLGKNISSFHGLTIFTISFSSALGMQSFINLCSNV